MALSSKVLAEYHLRIMSSSVPITVFLTECIANRVVEWHWYLPRKGNLSEWSACRWAHSTALITRFVAKFDLTSKRDRRLIRERDGFDGHVGGSQGRKVDDLGEITGYGTAGKK